MVCYADREVCVCVQRGSDKVAKCEYTSRCPYYNAELAESSDEALWVIARYCLNESRQCARHMLYRTLSGVQVPIDLNPHQGEQALQLLVAVGR